MRHLKVVACVWWMPEIRSQASRAGQVRPKQGDTGWCWRYTGRIAQSQWAQLRDWNWDQGCRLDQKGTKELPCWLASWSVFCCPQCIRWGVHPERTTERRCCQGLLWVAWSGVKSSCTSGQRDWGYFGTGCSGACSSNCSHQRLGMLDTEGKPAPCWSMAGRGSNASTEHGSLFPLNRCFPPDKTTLTPLYLLGCCAAIRPAWPSLPWPDLPFPMCSHQVPVCHLFLLCTSFVLFCLQLWGPAMSLWARELPSPFPPLPFIFLFQLYQPV